MPTSDAPHKSLPSRSEAIPIPPKNNAPYINNDERVPGISTFDPSASSPPSSWQERLHTRLTLSATPQLSE